VREEAFMEEASPMVDHLERHVGRHFASCRFSTFEAEGKDLAGALAIVESWASTYEPKCRGLFLTGPVGSGKTHLAIAAGIAVAEKWHTVGWIPVARTFEEMRASFGSSKGRVEASDLSRDWSGKRYNLVILDDIGVEQPTPWLCEQLFLLIDSLYVTDTTVIVTSNLGFSELGERLGERTVSRLVDLTDRVTIAGEDFRVKRARGRRSS
jgi:DNA replication protein DnaC